LHCFCFLLSVKASSTAINLELSLYSIQLFHSPRMFCPFVRFFVAHCQFCSFLKSRNKSVPMISSNNNNDIIFSILRRVYYFCDHNAMTCRQADCHWYCLVNLHTCFINYFSPYYLNHCLGTATLFQKGESIIVPDSLKVVDLC